MLPLFFLFSFYTFFPASSCARPCERNMPTFPSPTEKFSPLNSHKSHRFSLVIWCGAHNGNSSTDVNFRLADVYCVPQNEKKTMPENFETLPMESSLSMSPLQLLAAVLRRSIDTRGSRASLSWRLTEKKYRNSSVKIFGVFLREFQHRIPKMSEARPQWGIQNKLISLVRMIKWWFCSNFPSKRCFISNIFRIFSLARLSPYARHCQIMRLNFHIFSVRRRPPPAHRQHYHNINERWNCAREAWNLM